MQFGFGSVGRCGGEGGAFPYPLLIIVHLPSSLLHPQAASSESAAALAAAGRERSSDADAKPRRAKSPEAAARGVQREDGRPRSQDVAAEQVLREPRGQAAE